MMKFLFPALTAALLSAIAIVPAKAHDAKASYIANEGVMITHPHGDNTEIKILFDPLPLSGFGTYMDTPEAVTTALLRGTEPYNDINAVFISHAHRDHFSASKMIAFMKAQPQVRLVAPSQALAMMKAHRSWEAALEARMTILDMDYGDAPRHIEIDEIKASAVRIAHAGWPAPRRAIVQNMVFRVTLGNGPTVMHMGDADPLAQHFVPFDSHWQAQITDLGLPPYWFLTSPGGVKILKDINIVRSVGTHVPLNVPNELKNSVADYFSVSGESRTIRHVPK